MDQDYWRIDTQLRNFSISEIAEYIVTVSKDIDRLQEYMRIAEKWLILKKRVRDINNGGPKT